MSLNDDFRAAVYVTALVTAGVSAAMLVPAAFSYLMEWRETTAFAGSAIACGMVSGAAALATRGSPMPLTPRFGFLVVNMLWWLVPMIAAVPLVFGGAGLSFVDALFEAVSGFTTTGSTVMTGLEGVDRATLLWRSMTQWIGGVGILSLGLLLLPFLSAGGMQLFRMESSDRSEKPLPRFVATSKAVLSVYIALTLACTIGYGATGMSGFDAINHAMTTLSTGGYSTTDASLAHAGTGTLWVGTLFMMAGGMPFTVFVALAFTRTRFQRLDPQPLVFAVLVVGSVALLLVGRPGAEAHSFRGLTEDFFNVASIMTTTGYVTGDYTRWGGLSEALFFVITFFGACAGSTAGGLKTYRLIVMFQLVRASVWQMIHRNGVFPMRYGRHTVEPAVFRSAMVMAAAFTASLAALTVALNACGLDFLTSVSGALTALSNVGPGLGPVIGPVGNFASLPDAAKLILCVGMILGRLEILAVLALLTPALWRN